MDWGKRQWSWPLVQSQFQLWWFFFITFSWSVIDVKFHEWINNWLIHQQEFSCGENLTVSDDISKWKSTRPILLRNGRLQHFQFWDIFTKRIWKLVQLFRSGGITSVIFFIIWKMMDTCRDIWSDSRWCVRIAAVSKVSKTTLPDFVWQRFEMIQVIRQLITFEFYGTLNRLRNAVALKWNGRLNQLGSLGAFLT